MSTHSAHSPELHRALEDALSELDRLILVGDQGRRRRGVTTLSVETLRYTRLRVASVLTAEAPTETLRGVRAVLREGMVETAPLLDHAARLEALL